MIRAIRSLVAPAAALALLLSFSPLLPFSVVSGAEAPTTTPGGSPESPAAANPGLPEPPPEQLVPEDAVLVLRLSEAKPLLDLLLSEALIGAIEASPAYRAKAAEPGAQQLRNFVAYLESKFETDWPTIVRKLAGGGLTWAIGPGQSQLLVVDAEDAKMLKEINDVLFFLVKNDAANRGADRRVGSAEYRGVTGWTFGPGEAHAIVGNRLILSNEPAALRAALDRRAEPDSPSIHRRNDYQQAAKALGAQSGWLYADMTKLKHLPGLAEALEPGDNPLAVLLLAGAQEPLRASSTVALGFRVEGRTISLRLTGDGQADASGPARFALPTRPDDGAMPPLEVPRRLAAASFYRDLHGFYAAKDELFPQRTSGLIFFENMMGIFFTGRDLTEEVLAETEPELRLVVAEQQYSAEVGTPAVQIPAMAVVLRMKNPKTFSRVVEEAWQKAIGLVNFTRGQQALPGLIIDRPVHSDVKYTLAFFAPPEGGDRSAVDLRFNFQPSLAVVGDRLVLSSADALTRDLIDALEAEQARGAKPIAGAQSIVRLDGKQLHSILVANREAIVRQNMVEKGASAEEAGAAIDLLLNILEQVDSLSVDVATRDGRLDANAVLRLREPKAD